MAQWLRRRKPGAFYQKRLSEQLAAHLAVADTTATDLAAIINHIHEIAKTALRY